MTEILDSATLQKNLDMLLTVHDLCEMFSVSSMTIHTWRVTRDLPVMIIKGGPRDSMRNAVRFHPKDVANWARLQHLRMKPLNTRIRRVPVAA